MSVNGNTSTVFEKLSPRDENNALERSDAYEISNMLITTQSCIELSRLFLRISAQETTSCHKTYSNTDGITIDNKDTIQ